MNIFKNLYNYRELLKTNVKKEIRGRYKKSFLGVLWSFLNPLLMVAVYAVVFPIILKTQQPHYVVFLIVALIPWTFFTTIVSQGATTIVVNGPILKKVYFPREILPISVVTSGLVNFLISTVIIIIFLLGYGMGITKYIVFYPIIVVAQYFLLLGITFILSSITVYFRDIEHFIGVVLQLLFYATPIVYSMDTFPEKFKTILYCNPMTPIINSYRDIFYYQRKPELNNLILIFGVGIGLCLIGYLIFNRLQRKFAEEL